MAQPAQEDAVANDLHGGAASFAGWTPWMRTSFRAVRRRAEQEVLRTWRVLAGLPFWPRCP
jgi:hypothetical protein